MASDDIKPLLSDQDIDDIILTGGYRNAAGGIYATSVYAFAKEVAIAAIQADRERRDAQAQATGQAPQNDDETEGLRAHIALLKASLAQCERELDELRVATQAPAVPEGHILTEREALADLVVREACETEPADPDDPETIMIRRSDLRWATLAAMLAAAPTPPAQASGQAAPQAGEDARPVAPHLSDIEHPEQHARADSPESEGETFAAWLAREIPPGTVISNPAWWAPRILRAALRATPQPAAQAAPAVMGASRKSTGDAR